MTQVEFEQGINAIHYKADGEIIKEQECLAELELRRKLLIVERAEHEVKIAAVEAEIQQHQNRLKAMRDGRDQELRIYKLQNGRKVDRAQVDSNNYVL